VRRMLDPLTRRLVEPVTEAVLARLRQPEGPLGNNVAGTLRQVVEELVRQRLEEIENSVPPGEEGSDGSGAC
ncbi:MAG: hypothetical protein GWM87_04295, partial [Xanthomonadales bacterium]|nr:hypothetical protein [Xanthomonadales bacterium]NIX12233.1 hypothetical protein [Xanthomonadales bacterium]